MLLSENIQLVSLLKNKKNRISFLYKSQVIRSVLGLYRIDNQQWAL